MNTSLTQRRPVTDAWRDLDKLVLRAGCAGSEIRQRLGLDARVWWDCAPTASPVVWAVMLGCDAESTSAEARAALVPRLRQIATSRGSGAAERRRDCRALDWSLRTALPALLHEAAAWARVAGLAQSVGLDEAAATFAALVPITCGSNPACVRIGDDAVALRCHVRAFACACACAPGRARAPDLDRAVRELDVDLARALNVVRDLAYVGVCDRNRALARGLAHALANARIRITGPVDRALTRTLPDPVNPIALLDELIALGSAAA